MRLSFREIEEKAIASLSLLSRTAPLPMLVFSQSQHQQKTVIFTKVISSSEEEQHLLSLFDIFFLRTFTLQLLRTLSSLLFAFVLSFIVHQG